jgi:exonuclease III
MISRRVNILCVQETKWKGRKAKKVKDSDFKLWYTGTTTNKNGVSIVFDKSLKNGVVDIKRQRISSHLIKNSFIFSSKFLEFKGVLGFPVS